MEVSDLIERTGSELEKYLHSPEGAAARGLLGMKRARVVLGEERDGHISVIYMLCEDGLKQSFEHPGAWTAYEQNGNPRPELNPIDVAAVARAIHDPSVGACAPEDLLEYIRSQLRKYLG